MMLTVDTEGLEFCSKIFDDVRAMSKDGPGVTRQGYGPVETKTLDYLTAIGRDLGLEIKKDPAGNVWMTLPGKDRTLPAFVSGSHADSVPEGGNYDGLAGITAALYTARAMKKAGFTPKRDFTVLMMRCEESSFYGKSYIGSLAFTGKLTPDVTALTDRTKEKTLGEHMRECGFDPEKLTTGNPLMDLKKIAAFVELHIEQGPTLTSSETVRTGIVTGIRGNIRHKQVKIIGETAHSGAVDKPYRHDAVLACADFLSRMDKAWDEFSLRRRADELIEIRAQHAFAVFGARCYGESSIELLVAGRHDAEHVCDEWRIVALAVLPSGGACGQGFVVGLLRPFDFLFYGHVFPDRVPASVQEKQGEKPAHAAIPVVERMDAHEIEYEYQRYEDGVVRSILYLGAVFLANLTDGRRRRRGACRPEPCHELAVGRPLGDHVVGILPLSGERITAEPVQVAMEL